ncbi:hypothetical protein DMN91_001563 [Ooceraea biroi]|uniref:Reverse transcriptase domain-containing protein n=1 Tax=Ooceraea biroi TaxID=2015173 RepID=A0A3L8DY91_OOCBI|nr:hypothetical protein DMN91_001563 [Ooceraea biroi]
MASIHKKLFHSADSLPIRGQNQNHFYHSRAMELGLLISYFVVSSEMCPRVRRVCLVHAREARLEVLAEGAVSPLGVPPVVFVAMFVVRLGLPRVWLTRTIRMARRRDMMRPGGSVLEYANDTFVIGRAMDLEATLSRVNVQVAAILYRIRKLGLEIATDKTEAVLFYGRRKPSFDPVIRIDRTYVRMQPSMKYLGVMLDSRLSFLVHFRYAQGKVCKVTRALGRLMPNLRGPSEHKRLLYANVLESAVLYGAPIWSSALDVLREGPISKEAATEIRNEESLLMRRQWSLHLNRADAVGSRIRDVIAPHMEEWMSRRHGGLHFHLVQLLTGHGCFSTFLHRIGKLEDVGCRHCDGGADSAEHTLQECDAWEAGRRELIAIIGADLTLSAVVGAILRNREAWSAFSRFAARVMRIKEDAERARQAADDPLQAM